MSKQKIIELTNNALVEEFEVENTEFVPDADIKQTLELDSLGLVDLVALLEITFGTKIKGPELSSVKTFNDLYEFLHVKVNA